jgi:hypothetical protein
MTIDSVRYDYDDEDEAATSIIPASSRTSSEATGYEVATIISHDANGGSRKFRCVQIPHGTLTAAAFSGWHPPDDMPSELNVLLKHSDRGAQYFVLDGFTIHRPQTHPKRSLEMCALDSLQVKKGVGQLCFSGRLSMTTSTITAAAVTTTTRDSYYVRDVSFSTTAVVGCGDHECVSLSNKICIQSTWAQSRDVWYQLGRPSTEYKRFYKAFIWLATFTKFFIDFLLENEKDMTLHSFRSDFALWVTGRYGKFLEFKTWHQECGYQQDFDASAAAYVR